MIKNLESYVITKTWISGPSSVTLVIPKSIAEKHHLNTPSHVVIKSLDDGILIKKLEVKL